MLKIPYSRLDNSADRIKWELDVACGFSQNSPMFFY